MNRGDIYLVSLDPTSGHAQKGMLLVMNKQLIERVKAASAYTLNLAKVEAAIPHRGLRGRSREILIDNRISPWLPLDVKSGTGMIIDLSGKAR